MVMAENDIRPGDLTSRRHRTPDYVAHSHSRTDFAGKAVGLAALAAMCWAGDVVGDCYFFFFSAPRPIWYRMVPSEIPRSLAIELWLWPLSIRDCTSFKNSGVDL